MTLPVYPNPISMLDLANEFFSRTYTPYTSGVSSTYWVDTISSAFVILTLYWQNSSQVVVTTEPALSLSLSSFDQAVAYGAARTAYFYNGYVYFKGPLVTSSYTSPTDVQNIYQIARVAVPSLSVSQFYAGGSYVPSGTVGYPSGASTAIPSSGQISFSNFHGTGKHIPQLYTFNASGSFTIPAGVTSMQILVVGGGGAGGNAVRNRVGDNPSSGGGGGAGQVTYLIVSGGTGTLTISIGSGGTSAQTQGGATSVVIPSYGTITAVGGYRGSSNSSDSSNGGTGGTSGNGYAGATALFVDAGGGGGGATGIGDEIGTGGAPYTVDIGGTTFEVGRGGDGAGFTSIPANSGNGGSSATRINSGTSYGYAGASGIVVIYC